MTRFLLPSPCEELAVLRSVVYASLFDYPLTPLQLKNALIGEAADETTLIDWFHNSDYLQRRIEFVDGHFFPRGRRDLLQTRLRRERISRTLLEELDEPLKVMSRLPFVRMLAVSGSLAHLNADADADLDLFVITRPHRVWTTTVAALAIARLRGWRKRICLNYVVSERALWIAPADLFSANQIVHLRPFTGAATYERFLEANRFVFRFYPNFAPHLVTSTAASRTWLERLVNYTVGPLLEQFCRLLYRTHLQRQSHTWKSKDQVRLEAECLKLHTQSHRREVMERFERALNEAVGAVDSDEWPATREEWLRLQASP